MTVSMHRISRSRLVGGACFGLIVGLAGIAPCASAQPAPPQQQTQPQNPDNTLLLQGQAPRASAVAGKTPRAGAPFDLTGYWVAVINEDWRWRMITPEKGDFAGI